MPTVDYRGGAAFPSGLKDLNEAAETVGLTPERLLELADADIAPHYRIDGGPPKMEARDQ